VNNARGKPLRADFTAAAGSTSGDQIGSKPSCRYKSRRDQRVKTIPVVDGHIARHQAGNMKLLPTVLVLFFVASATSAISADQVMIAGIGSKSCTHWKSTPELKAEGEKWAFGFWSGLNYVAAVTKQQNQLIIDPQKMLDEIERMCVERPSQSLADTVWITFLTLNKTP
jgi:hypothetical protein